MRHIRPLDDLDWDDCVEISANAYPGLKIRSQSERDRFRQRLLVMARDPIIHFYGLFDDSSMQGVMRLYDFTMNLYGREVLVGGLGGVAVDLCHKKEHVAYDMVQFFLNHYREQGAALTALYPFRPDFYKQMGFGYGRLQNQYRVRPADLPDNGDKRRVALLTARDRRAQEACYTRVMGRTHGLMQQSIYAVDSLFQSPTLKLAGYWDEEGWLRGYLVFQFEPTDPQNFLRQEIVVRYMVYETAAALQGLLAFLHAQADQVDRVVFHTQEDDFHWLLHDPRDDSQQMMPPVFHQSSTEGVGLMYRVVDVPAMLAAMTGHGFGGQQCRLSLTITDSFFPANAGQWSFLFENGRVRLLAAEAPVDVTMQLDVAAFSSLAMGVTTVKQLWRYGLIALEVDDVECVHRLFVTEQKPVCWTAF